MRSRPLRALSALVLIVHIAFCLAATAAGPAGSRAPDAALLSRLGISKGQSDPVSGIQEYRLKANGLTVLLVERHTAPVVTVMMVYKVGSRNEAVGYTGATHFLEHMMFKGSARFDPKKGTGIDDVLKPTGGYNNATTSFDRTNYFVVAPSKDLDLCLSFEADRMRNLLLRKEDRDAEMTVVRNELERGENEPTSVLHRQLFATAFREHPYHHPTIGWRSDVEGVPLARLKKFYDDFYWPNNAYLLITGDIDSARTLELVSRKFSQIPRSPRPIPPVYTEEPPQEGERRFTIRRGDDEPRLMIAYHVPRAAHDATYPLDVLDAVLGDDSRQASRFYRALVETGLAADASAFNYSMKDPGLLIIAATPAPGVSPAALEAAIHAEIEKLRSEPVSAAELKRAKASVIKNMTILASDPHVLCEQLAESIAVADWQFWTGYKKKLEAVTADDIKRAAVAYLTPDNMTVGYYLPKNYKEADAGRQKAGESSRQAGGAASELPAHKPVARASKPAAGARGFSSQVKRKVLQNGLTVLAMPVPGTGAVSLCGQIRAGRNFASADKSLVPELLCQLFTKGSKQFTKADLAERLDLMGTSIDVRPGNFFLQVSSDVVVDDLPAILPLIADAVANPLLEGEELKRSVAIMESQIKQRMTSTRDLANNSLLNHLYEPGCPYYQKPFPEQLNELTTIGIEDLKKFHERFVNPANTVIAIVGDIEPGEAFTLVEASFKNWPAGEATPVAKPVVTMPAKARRIDVAVKGKENADVVIGHPLMLTMKDKDFFAELIANAALGHDSFSSRLAPVRDKYGLSYGIGSSNKSVAFGGGPWSIDFSVNPANVGRALSIVHSLVSDYQKQGITAKELSEESRRLAGEYMVGLRTPAAIAEVLSVYAMVGLGPEFMDAYPGRLAAVKLGEVNQAIRRYLAIDRSLTVVAAPSR